MFLRRVLTQVIMNHNYNLRSSQQVETEIPSPAPPSTTVGVDHNEDVMKSSESQGRALSNDLIMMEVFNHLSVEDLKECRLVNKVWNQVATRVFASKAHVVTFADQSGTPSIQIMEKFIDSAMKSEPPPYRKFVINGGVLFKASPAQQLVLPCFIERVAPTVSHLGVYGGGIRLFPRKKPKKGIEYPRLKSLELFIVPLKRDERWVPLKSNEDFMISILHHAPKLDTITLLDVGHEYADRLIENIPWVKIRHLKLQGRLEDDNFQKIIKQGTAMKLQTFNMVAWKLAGEHEQLQASSGTAFPRFLAQQSGSLESLQLQFLYCLPEPHPDFRLPRFPNLKTLEVNIVFMDYHYNAREANRLLAVPSFSETFPALNCLKISGIETNDLCAFLHSDDSAPVETLRTLRLDLPDEWDWDDADVEPNDIQQVVRHLSQMFPNICKLAVPADVHVMKAIDMEHAWQHLKHLTLLCGETLHVDSALVGHSVQYDRIYNLKHGSRQYAEEERKIESKCKIFKFFENLHTLELELNDDNPHPELTGFSDLSCRLVLLKLRNLKRLNLCGLGHQAYQVTKPMIKQMSAKFKVLYKELE